MINWGRIPEAMTDAAAQIRKAQENLEKVVNQEIERRTTRNAKAWRMQIAQLLRERESLRYALQQAGRSVMCPAAVLSALQNLKYNDAQWFPGTTAKDYADALENFEHIKDNPPVDSRPPAKDVSETGPG